MAASSLLSLDDGRKKASAIFEEFIKVGSEFSLTDTPCVKMLQDAIVVCNNGASQEVVSRLSRADKIIQKTRQTAPSYTANPSKFCVTKQFLSSIAIY